ncbi:hypothetical protein BD410DRAFT_791734 [Rickenella mellea]|uniref:Methyltransferase domain-containing protein n=1 Tax=Rickenella mellea TaxID=50990 RepID=A0A4Y7PWR2_9AGAM|nr:hypothetical protein BD410DRAFT_791734 [Rickenella mellea]
MPSIFQRHPRYSLFTGFVLLATFLLLASQHAPPPGFSGAGGPVADPFLKNRLATSERIYQKLLTDRKGLIKKFGPTPDKISLFPPDVEPWPPYTVWDFFPAAFNCPHEIERIGALGDGGKWVCGLSRVQHKPDCVVYSIGINHESSFEAGILSRTSGCQIWGYDFSVQKFGPEISSTMGHRAHFKPWGLAGVNAHGPNDENKMYTLASLMQLNGHTHIDILKIDIEGWEFETLSALLKTYVDAGQPLPFGQLQLEIHIWSKNFAQYLQWWEMLEDAGLRPFWTEPNLVYQNYNKGGTSDLAEYSFLNIKGANEFIGTAPRSVRHGPRD